MAGLKKYELETGHNPIRWIGGESLPAFLTEVDSAVAGILKAGFDSLFFFSDEGVDFVYKSLSRLCRIPEDFGIVTLNGSGEGLSCNPPITAIGHASEGVARTLVEQMTRIFDKGPGKVGKILIKPVVHWRTTLSALTKTK